MNDIYGAFANAYKSGALDNAPTQSDSKSMISLFSNSNDLEGRPASQASTASTISQSFENIKGKLFSSNPSE